MVFGEDCAEFVETPCDARKLCERRHFDTQEDYVACLNEAQDGIEDCRDDCMEASTEAAEDAAEAADDCGEDCNETYEADAADCQDTLDDCVNGCNSDAADCNEACGDVAADCLDTCDGDPACAAICNAGHTACLSGCALTRANCEAACIAAFDACMAPVTLADARCIADCGIAQLTALKAAQVAFDNCLLPCCSEKAAHPDPCRKHCDATGDGCDADVEIAYATCQKDCLPLDGDDYIDCNADCGTDYFISRDHCAVARAQCYRPCKAADMREQEWCDWFENRCYVACEEDYEDDAAGCEDDFTGAVNACDSDPDCFAAADAARKTCLQPKIRARYACRMACCQGGYFHDAPTKCYADCWRSANCDADGGFTIAGDCHDDFMTCLELCPGYAGDGEMRTCNPCGAKAWAAFAFD